MSENYVQILGDEGDIILQWNKNDHDAMKKFIQEQMDKGYSFFIVKKNAFGLIRRDAKLLSSEQLKPGVEIKIKDKDAMNAFMSGAAHIVKGAKDKISSSIETIKKCTTADEVMNNDTIAMKPLRGG